jgi:nucleoside-triphosphatase
MSTKNILLTGSPGCGKTSVIQAVVAQLRDVPLAGFFTREIRKKGQRIGFEAVGLRGNRCVLARVGSSTRYRVGRYGVEVEEFELLLGEELENLNKDVRAFVIDEIGKMECFSPRFVKVVRHLLDGSRPVLATIALKATGFIAEVKSRDDRELITVSMKNRNDLPATIAGELRALIHGSDG